MSTLKTTYIQHPSAESPAIELTAEGTVALPLSGIGNLVDVDEGSGAADGDVLTYDSTGSVWVPQPIVVPSGLPSGSLIWFAANAAPTGFLKANGATISRTTYADLFTAIGTTFGAGDGSTTFTLPDLRGEFIRGWDDARGIDSGRALGSAQGDLFKSHVHYVPGYKDDSPQVSTFSSAGTLGDPNRGVNTYGNGGSETRPRNVALLACIKY